MPTCEITGITASRDLFGIHKHHFIKQQHYKKDPVWYQERGIKQRLIYLWYKLHASVHSGISDKAFKKRWGIERHEVLFSKRAWRDGKYQI